MTEYIKNICVSAREASYSLAVATTEEKNAALAMIADDIVKNSAKIIAANSEDLENGKMIGLSAALLDRLMLNEDRIKGIADGIRAVAALPDPVGRLLDKVTRPNGLSIVKEAVPIGVIAVIYEARPNVTADSAALCLKSGNAVILRGGKEAVKTNIAIADAMREALAGSAVPVDSVQLITDTTHESANELMCANGYVDVLIPRGGKRLISTVIKNSTVPVIETGAGVCHVYVDEEADINMAAEIIFNAKTSRPSVCNAAECMLINRKIAKDALPVIAQKLSEKNVEIRADAESLAILGNRAVPASDDDFGYEFGDYIIACRVVGDVTEAIEHIRRYSTNHSESIVTDNDKTAQFFMNSVDSAAVYHNASTRFTDGGEFGLGAEIGISTQKLHARGPLGLNELTSMKYKIYGNGQTR